MNNIKTNEVYTCISTKVLNFNYGDKVRVLHIEWHNDLLEVVKLGLSSIHYIGYKEFENCFVTYSEDSSSSFDDILSRQTICECGIHKTYGRHGTEFLHSDFCPLYIKKA